MRGLRLKVNRFFLELEGAAELIAKSVPQPYPKGMSKFPPNKIRYRAIKTERDLVFELGPKLVL